MIRFFVPGAPASMGSPQVITRGRGGVPLKFPIVAKDSPKLKRWQKAVAQTARLHYRGDVVDGLVRVCVVFFFDRPKSHTGKRGLKSWAPRVQGVKPDIDKLLRATLDPMSQLIYVDDARIADVCGHKRFATPRGTGALIKVALWTEPMFHVPPPNEA